MKSHEKFTRILLTKTESENIFMNRINCICNNTVKGSGTLELSEHGHTWTTVKSIQYSPDCEFPRRAGAEIYVIVCVVAVVLLVAVAAFTWSRFRKRRELSQVPTEDSA